MEAENDIRSTVEKAKALASMLGGGGEIDLNSISRLVGLFQGMKNNQSEKREEKKALSFDTELESPPLRSIKAAIPYLEAPYARGLGLIVKLIEIDSLLNKYGALERNMVYTQAITPDNKRKMLEAVSDELEGKQRQLLKLFMGIVEIKNMMEVYFNEGA